jgi:flagellin FlaB
MDVVPNVLPERPESRAQVGIGTLIVFIAMVLVATLAAGVLIDTTSLLQSDGQQAGHESIDGVSGRLQVFGVYGNVTGEYNDKVSKSGNDVLPNSTVNTLRITVGLAPAANPVDMRNVTIYWYGPEATTALLYGGSNQYAPGHDTSGGFGTNDLSPAPGGGGGGGGAEGTHETFHTYSYNTDRHSVVTTTGQRLSIYINAAAVESETNDNRRRTDVAPLREGEEVTLVIETESGGETQLRFTIPESLDSGSVVEL